MRLLCVSYTGSQCVVCLPLRQPIGHWLDNSCTAFQPLVTQTHTWSFCVCVNVIRMKCRVCVTQDQTWFVKKIEDKEAATTTVWYVSVLTTNIGWVMSHLTSKHINSHEWNTGSERFPVHLAHKWTFYKVDALRMSRFQPVSPLHSYWQGKQAQRMRNCHFALIHVYVDLACWANCASAVIAFLHFVVFQNTELTKIVRPALSLSLKTPRSDCTVIVCTVIMLGTS